VSSSVRQKRPAFKNSAQSHRGGSQAIGKDKSPLFCWSQQQLTLHAFAFAAQQSLLTSDRPQPLRRNAGKTAPQDKRGASRCRMRTDDANKLIVLKRSKRTLLSARLAESSERFILWQRAERWRLFVKRQQTHKR